MVCSMVRKGLLGAALSAGALFLVFGTSAPNYVKTAFHRFRQSAKDAVPPQFEIDRARDEIEGLRPQIEKNIELLARAEVDAEHLEKEVHGIQSNLDVEKKIILGLRDRVKTGEFRLAGHVTDAVDEAKCELAHRYDHYKNVAQLLSEKQAELKAKKKTIQAAHDQLENLRTQKSILLGKLSSIEAQLRVIEATQAKNEFSFDDSALAHAKQTVSDLEKRLKVLARRVEMEGRYADLGTASTYVEPGRDVLKEVDDAFGPNAAKSSETAEKSL
jgi:chromosome segregation ATPase